MEDNRDVTVHRLNEQGASVTEPADCLDYLEVEEDEQHENESDNTKTISDIEGKTSLLAYLLSWQLILQIFQASTLDKRAKLANFLHRGQHVSDLATCLFCVMPSSSLLSLEQFKKVDAQGTVKSLLHSILFEISP